MIEIEVRDDEAFCRVLADGCGVPFDVERSDVASVAARPGRSLEEAAREVRYAFLERARRRLGADVVAVAHTLDDQAETVLLRLLSGAGTRGLGAMRPLPTSRMLVSCAASSSSTS